MPEAIKKLIKCYECGKQRPLKAQGWILEDYDESKKVWLCPKCLKSYEEVPGGKAKSEAKIEVLKLTKKQLQVLEIIFSIDQDRESEENGKYFNWLDGEKARPAAEWRWIIYGLPTIFRTELFDKLSSLNLTNQGLGRIFSTLKEKNLILAENRSVQTTLGKIMMPSVQMTTIGRKYLRKRLGLTKEKSESKAKYFPEWMWQILDRLYQSNELPQDENREYAGISWKIWLRFKFFRQGAIVKEFRLVNNSGVLKFTDFGLEFYEKKRLRKG
ncbi:MAG TPA: hypothetical protein PKY82_00625 [Pyrinomonadaceae bacterium]|nr:hypothetical protein [Pyrinomonadaceae bacterium]